MPSKIAITLIAASVVLAGGTATAQVTAPAPGSGSSRGAPGPLAGAGLPILMMAGGCALLRHRRRAKGDEPQTVQRDLEGSPEIVTTSHGA
jgi:hypothetical protein